MSIARRYRSSATPRSPFFRGTAHPAPVNTSCMRHRADTLFLDCRLAPLRIGHSAVDQVPRGAARSRADTRSAPYMREDSPSMKFPRVVDGALQIWSRPPLGLVFRIAPSRPVGSGPEPCHCEYAPLEVPIDAGDPPPAWPGREPRLYARPVQRPASGGGIGLSLGDLAVPVVRPWARSPRAKATLGRWAVRLASPTVGIGRRPAAMPARRRSRWHDPRLARRRRPAAKSVSALAAPGCRRVPDSLPWTKNSAERSIHRSFGSRNVPGQALALRAISPLNSKYWASWPCDVADHF